MISRTIYALAPREWSLAGSVLERAQPEGANGASCFKPEASAALAQARLRTLLANPDTCAWFSAEEAGAGFAAMTLLPWDSQQLGLTAARLDYFAACGSYDERRDTLRELLAVVCEAGRDLGVRHLSARVSAAELCGLHALEADGFITLDSILTFACDLDAATPSDPAPSADFTLRLARPADAERAAALARSAYVYDRFHSDPSVATHVADELHAEWVRNSCAGRAADAVVLAESEEGLLGYVTCKIQRDAAEHLGRPVGTIVLVATDGSARGRGVARAATHAALEWFRGQGCAVVEVGTQLRNLPASRLYQRCGFTLAGASISLRKIL